MKKVFIFFQSNAIPYFWGYFFCLWKEKNKQDNQKEKKSFKEALEMFFKNEKLCKKKKKKILPFLSLFANYRAFLKLSIVELLLVFFDQIVPPNC